ncbi:MAG TPA: hypothetical protein VL588_01755 [Bdellovibrionota bacterium]|nr:hypothetical protein [Bdellovibrionota bacterium]
MHKKAHRASSAHGKKRSSSPRRKGTAKRSPSRGHSHAHGMYGSPTAGMPSSLPNGGFQGWLQRLGGYFGWL